MSSDVVTGKFHGPLYMLIEYMQCCTTLSCVMCHVDFDLALLFKAHFSEASLDSCAGGLI